MSATSSFLPPLAWSAACLPWAKSLALVGALHLSAMGGWALRHHVFPPEVDEFGAEGTIELTALVLPAESAYAPEVLANEAEDRPETRKREEIKAEEAPRLDLAPVTEPDSFTTAPPEPPEPEKPAVTAAEESTASVASQAMPAAPEVKGEKNAEDQPAPAGTLPDARQRLEAWQKRLFAHIGKFKHYPEAARAARAQGEILVAFRLDAEGGVADVRVASANGHALLNDAAIDVIRRAAPLPRPPADLAGKPLDLVLPLRFSLK